MKVLSFAVSFPRHHAKIKEQGYISLKLHVVALNDLNMKCFSSLRDGPSLGNDLWRFSVINAWRIRVEFLGSPLLSAILQAS